MTQSTLAFSIGSEQLIVPPKRRHGVPLGREVGKGYEAIVGKSSASRRVVSHDDGLTDAVELRRRDVNLIHPSCSTHAWVFIVRSRADDACSSRRPAGSPTASATSDTTAYASCSPQLATAPTDEPPPTLRSEEPTKGRHAQSERADPLLVEASPAQWTSGPALLTRPARGASAQALSYASISSSSASATFLSMRYFREL